MYGDLLIMKNKIMVFTCFFIIIIPMAKGNIPGTFFWKPRLGIDLAIPSTEPTAKALLPTIENIESGAIVIIDGYQAGITCIGLASGLSGLSYMPTLHPGSAFYYTNAYRWFLRYISLLPFWASGNGGHYCDTHRVWRRRFYYMDEFMPEWIQKFFFYVNKSSWDQEKDDFKKFKKYAESAFGKHFRYPSKVFNEFASEYTQETVEDMSISLTGTESKSESGSEHEEHEQQ